MPKLIEPRSLVANLASYEPGDYKAEIYLAANENPYDIPAELKNEILTLAQKLPFHRYPHPLSQELRAVIAASYGVQPANVVIGNGGDELLLYLLLAYGGSERKAVTFGPTFVMYKILAQLTGCQFKELERDSNFNLPANFLEQVEKEQAKLVFICSPNNPSGNIVAPEQVKALLEGERLVVLDEAYAEFSGFSLASWLQAYPNLVILRTFSKAFSLAGLRLGYLLAHEDVITSICKVKLPYNVNRFSSLAGLVLWQHQEKLKPVIRIIVEQRDWLYQELRKFNWLTVYPSEANFILVKSQKAELWQSLLNNGILVRQFKIKGEEYLRLTVGKPEENKRLIEVLGD